MLNHHQNLTHNPKHLLPFIFCVTTIHLWGYSVSKGVFACVEFPYTQRRWLKGETASPSPQTPPRSDTHCRQQAAGLAEQRRSKKPRTKKSRPRGAWDFLTDIKEVTIKNNGKLRGEGYRHRSTCPPMQVNPIYFHRTTWTRLASHIKEYNPLMLMDTGSLYPEMLLTLIQTAPGVESSWKNGFSALHEQIYPSKA